MVRRRVDIDKLPANSFERFLREIGITRDLADVRFAGAECDFELVSLRGIDMKLEGPFPLFVPSKDGFSKERIYVDVGDKKWVLLSAEREYRVGQFILTCVDATPGSTSYEVVSVAVSFLRKIMTNVGEIENDEPFRSYDSRRRESWLGHMRRAAVANHIR